MYQNGIKSIEGKEILSSVWTVRKDFIGEIIFVIDSKQCLPSDLKVKRKRSSHMRGRSRKCLEV